MTCQLVEGFDWFPTGKSDSERETLWGANAFFKYGGPTANVYSPGRFGYGKAFGYVGTFLLGGATDGYVKPIYAVQNEGYCAFAFYKDATNDANLRPGVGFFDGPNGSCQFFVSFERFGIIRVYRGMPGGDASNPSTLVIGTSKTGSFEEDQWFFVEIFGKIGDTDGEVQIRINTVIKLDLVDVDNKATSATTYDAIFMGCWHATGNIVQNWLIDDLEAHDSAGTTMNSFMGNLRVKTQVVIGDGSHLDFTIGGTSPAATNWQSVLNDSLNDTKYVFSPTIGDYDLYEIDPNLNSPEVRVVQVRAALRQDDSTQRSAKMVIKVASTGLVYEDDEEHFVNQTYTFYFGRWELNPATSVSFTGTEVNALEVGVKVES